MKLLLLTQKININDDVLGFMHSWTEEFSKHCELVTVVCLERGEYKLPKNIRVLSLGKDEFLRLGKHFGFIRKLVATLRFYNYIIRERKNYDKVFVHMNKEYVLLGGLLWKIWGKKIGLWYAHGATSFGLKIAEKLSDIIFTSTQSGFRIKSDKVKVIGQGIEVNTFKPAAEKKRHDIFKIITIGRISPVKDYETLIKAVEILAGEGIRLEVNIIGGVGMPEQEKYLENLKKMIAEKGLGGIMNFIGAVPNKNIVRHLQSADLFVNMSYTGSLDKAILEAMACGLPVLTCNEALIEVLGEYRKSLMYDKGDYKNLAEMIKLFAEMEEEKREKIAKDLRDIVVKNHSLEGFIKKIIEKFN
ncbi:MAG: glycosyltransferase family 4 protein [Patescibacteria group bacterium]|nr:glycosyltransferase family 4 protein [Patescibacteria group bacterium]